MDPRGPIQSWHYLAIGNVVPAAPARQLSTSCALCGRDTLLDPRGALYTAPNGVSVVCDACGDREAPDEMALVRQLRRCEGLTAAVTAATLDHDVWALVCPICHREQDPDDCADDGSWRVVDAVNGRQVCADCVPKVDPALLRLAAALDRLESRNRLFDTFDPKVRH